MEGEGGRRRRAFSTSPIITGNGQEEIFGTVCTHTHTHTHTADRVCAAPSLLSPSWSFLFFLAFRLLFFLFSCKENQVPSPLGVAAVVAVVVGGYSIQPSMRSTTGMRALGAFAIQTATTTVRPRTSQSFLSLSLSLSVFFQDSSRRAHPASDVEQTRVKKSSEGGGSPDLLAKEFVGRADFDHETSGVVEAKVLLEIGRTGVGREGDVGSDGRRRNRRRWRSRLGRRPTRASV